MPVFEYSILYNTYRITICVVAVRAIVKQERIPAAERRKSLATAEGRGFSCGPDEPR